MAMINFVTFDRCNPKGFVGLFHQGGAQFDRAYATSVLGWSTEPATSDMVPVPDDDLKDICPECRKKDRGGGSDTVRPEAKHPPHGRVIESEGTSLGGVTGSVPAVAEEVKPS